MSPVVSFCIYWFFFATNYVGTLFISEIKEINLGNARIIGYDKKYLNELINIWNSWEPAYFSKKHRHLLDLYGKKTCFLMIHKDGRLIGFIYFVFHFDDLMNRKIHSHYGCINPEFRGYGYGPLLFISAWNSFRKTKWLLGISARYSLDNNSSRRLHEKSGFKAVKEYYDAEQKKQMIYAVCDFHNDSSTNN